MLKFIIFSLFERRLLVSHVGTTGSAGSSSVEQSEDPSVMQEHSTRVALNTLMNGIKAGRTKIGFTTQCTSKEM